MIPEVRQTAIAWLKRGVAVIPLPYGQKVPSINNWTNLRIPLADVDQYFESECNIGLVLGKPSKWYVDVDLDTDEAVIVANLLLPSTLTFGRDNRPISHRLYQAEDARTRKYQFKGTTLVELRATGCQTIIPPSVHPDGQRIRRDEGNVSLCRLTAIELEAGVSKVAAAALLASAWNPGSRHDSTLALAGGLLNAEWNMRDTACFVEAVILAAGDPEARDRIAAVRDTFTNHHNGKPCTGWPRLAALLGADTVDKAREWLGISKDIKSGISTTTVDEISESWPEPKPLPQEIPSVEAFEPALLPRAFQPWIEDLAERMQCPLDFLAVGSMIALAGVVGRKVAIRPKQHDSWLVVPNLWGAIVARPGQKKTPALQEVLRPLRQLEAAHRTTYEELTKRWHAESLVRKAQKKVLERQVAERAAHDLNASDLADQILELDLPQPTRRRLVVNDSTVEKLGELLNQNPNGLLVFRDELVGLLRSLDKESQKGVREFYLECWSGTGRHTVDRIGRGTLDIEAAVLSILGGIQPGPLASYLHEVAQGYRGDDGLLQRFQLIVWPDAPSTWRYVDRPPNEIAQSHASAVFEELDTKDFGGFGGASIPYLPNTVVTQFDNAAGKRFVEFLEELEAKIREEEVPAIEAHLAKYRSLVPSLALLIHLAESDGGPVRQPALIRAAGWAQYLESHARRVFASLAHKEVASANRLLRKLKKGVFTGTLTVRDIYHERGWGGLTDRDTVQEAVDLLVDFGYLRALPARGPGRPTVRYCLHPRLRSEVRD